MQSIRLANW